MVMYSPDRVPAAGEIMNMTRRRHANPTLGSSRGGFAGGGSAWAQETRGNINGTVQDSSGVIPGATVTVTNVDTGQTQRLVTNSSGYFEAPLLQPGSIASRST